MKRFWTRARCLGPAASGALQMVVDAAVDLVRKAAVNGIEQQQMRVGFDRPQIVHRHDYDILAAGLDDGPQDIAADAAKSVDGNANWHVTVSFTRIAIISGPYRRLGSRRKGGVGRPAGAICWPQSPTEHRARA